MLDKVGVIGYLQVKEEEASRFVERAAGKLLLGLQYKRGIRRTTAPYHMEWETFA